MRQHIRIQGLLVDVQEIVYARIEATRRRAAFDSEATLRWLLKIKLATGAMRELVFEDRDDAEEALEQIEEASKAARVMARLDDATRAKLAAWEADSMFEAAATPSTR